MKKFSCLAVLMLVLITGTFRATGQEEAIELVNTFGRGTVHQAVLSADGERVVVAGSRGVWVYDSEFNDLAHIETGTVQRMAWSSDDQYLAVVTEDSQLSIWNMADYQLHAEVELPDERTPRYAPITWQPNSHLLVLAYRDKIALWNADTRAFEDSILITTQSDKTDAAWSPDGVQLAIASASEVQLWTLGSTVPVFQIDLRDSEYAGRRSIQLAWSPDATRIAVVEGWRNDVPITGHNTLSIINANTGETTLVMQAGLAADVAWSPDGTMLATATAESGNRTRTPINVWDALTGRLVAELVGHTREAHTVQWLPDGQHLLSAADDSKVRIWQVQPLGVIQFHDSRILNGHMDRVDALAWTPDGSQLASGSVDGSIRVWDVESGEMIETNYQSDLRGVQALDYSPDGQYLAAGGGENWVRIWQLTDDRQFIYTQYVHGRHASPGAGNPTGITAVAWSPDSSRLASGGYDATVRLWQPEKLAEPLILRQGGWYPLSLYWTLDAGRLVIGAPFGPEIWDIASGEQILLECEGMPNSYIHPWSMSPDRRYLFVTDEMGPFYLCDLEQGERLNVAAFVRVWNPVHPVVMGSNVQGAVILFDPLTYDNVNAEPIAELEVDTPIRIAVWSPDGRYLAIGLEDGAVQLWELKFD